MKFFAVLIVLALILMVGALMSATAYADDTEEPNPNGININAGLFPDEQLLSIVSSSKIDRDQNGFLSDFEISCVTSLEVPSCYTLEGIAYLSSLQSLTVNNFRGDSRYIDISNNNALTYLYIKKASDLSNLDVSSNKALTCLKLKDMPIEKLDLSNNEELTYLSLENCKELPELELYKNTKLEDLKLEGSKIEKLDLRMNKSLKTLSVTDALVPSYVTGAIPLKELDVSGCSSLETITIDNSKVDWLNLNGCENLKRVSAAHCKIQCVYAVGVDTLEYFNGEFNENMKEAYFTGCSSLNELILNGVALEKFDLTGCSSLRIFHAYGVNIGTLDLTDCAALYQLYLTNSKIRSIDLSGCPELYDVILDENDLQSLDVTHNTKLNSLQFSNQTGNGDMNIGALDLSACPDLVSLSCDNAKVTSLNLSNCTKLEILRVGENLLTELDLSNFPNLKELIAFGNKISKLDISNCPGLCTCLKNGMDSNANDELWDYRYFYYTDNDTWESYCLGFDDKTLLIYDEGTYMAPKKSLEGAEIKLGTTSYVYNGKSRKPSVKVYRNGNEVPTDCYSVSYKNNVNVGTATVTVTGKGNYEGTAKATFKITKATNNFTASGKTATAKYSLLKKGSVTLLRSKVIGYSNKKGTLTYTKSSGNSRITINKTTGKLKIAKGLKKGTYKVKVKVKDSGSKNYKAKTVNVTITIKVK